jgi:hypothetical protein
MIKIVMQNSHHGNHEPALAARIEKTYGGNLETRSVMKVGFLPWQHQCDGSAGRRLDVPVVGNSPEDAANNSVSLLPFPPFDNPTISKLINERLGRHPTQPGLISDLDQSGSANSMTTSALAEKRKPHILKNNEEQKQRRTYE